METNTVIKDALNKKRACKSIRACWECKKRRVQGNSTLESDITGLTDRSSQANVEEEPCPIHIGERLSKLELLFEKFVCRKLSNVGATQEVPQNPTLIEGTEEKQMKCTFGLPEITSDAQSISSIGDSILAGQHSNWNSAPSIKTLVDNGDDRLGPSSETIRRSLVALLPSQQDASVILESTNGWMIFSSTYKPAKVLFVNGDPESYSLDMSAVAQEPSVVVARTLLHLAICIGSLPPSFDISRLSHIWSLDTTMQNYVTTVTTLVTSSDEQVSTLPGLETLMLLAVFHMNNANLRQSWLIIRRALNLAHLMGFHHIISHPSSSSTIEAVDAAKFIWRGLVDADRYLGLHLRLPFAADEYPCPEDASPALVHRSSLCAISREISNINHSITPQSYVQALAVDEKLDSSMKALSKQFWEVPNIPPTARTNESAAVIERLIVQIWHFELKIFLHLPFLLRAPKESKFEFSKITALQAARNVIMRWFALRNAEITQACCRLAELGVFIATVTIALDILIEMGTKEKSEVQRTRGSDFAMVCRVIGEMEKLSKASSREKIAHRSAIILKKILSSVDPSKRTAGKARLTIPYFGTIEVKYHTPPVRPAFDLDSDTGKKLNSHASGSHLPVFSFVSNALWPPAESSWDGQLDFDIVLFDGLEDRDLDGNWVF
ncbi:hypothetical protein K469DRAFT_651726 [Zopfia rhizophila CBS 207.26]|uniref:Transcription factor domain-containing protein n=1 Tax=Zopfia rhizophila CBS 207.26 TaxID=1314779 RepID=A0A6A6ETG4_9PEZI|nr:hypothetical protein K469DRAFT_651726 [Zopfia rhizophila CBS 207.26]